MIVFGILLSIVGFGFFCWLLFMLAVYALPFFAAISVGMWAYHSGTGPIGATAVGMIGGVLTLVLGQFIFTVVRSIWLRVMIALLFATPAACAGYYAILGLAKLTMLSASWRIPFSIIGAVIVGVTAWTRMAVFEPARPIQGVARAQSALRDGVNVSHGQNGKCMGSIS